MAYKEKSLNLLTHRKVLRSVILRPVWSKVSTVPAPIMIVLICQWVAVEDVPEMAQVLHAERRRIEHIIEEELAHRVQVVASSELQFQAMGRLDAQEKELRRHSALLM